MIFCLMLPCSKLLADVRSLIASMNKADHYEVPQITNYLNQYRLVLLKINDE